MYINNAKLTHADTHHCVIRCAIEKLFKIFQELWDTLAIDQGHGLTSQWSV